MYLVLLNITAKLALVLPTRAPPLLEATALMQGLGLIVMCCLTSLSILCKLQGWTRNSLLSILIGIYFQFGCEKLYRSSTHPLVEINSTGLWKMLEYFTISLPLST